MDKALSSLQYQLQHHIIPYQYIQFSGFPSNQQIKQHDALHKSLHLRLVAQILQYYENMHEIMLCQVHLLEVTNTLKQSLSNLSYNLRRSLFGYKGHQCQPIFALSLQQYLQQHMKESHPLCFLKNHVFKDYQRKLMQGKVLPMQQRFQAWCPYMEDLYYIKKYQQLKLIEELFDEIKNIIINIVRQNSNENMSVSSKLWTQISFSEI